MATYFTNKAAIKYRNKVYVGRTYGDIMERLPDEAESDPSFKLGFISKQGKFFSQKEAVETEGSEGLPVPGNFAAPPHQEAWPVIVPGRQAFEGEQPRIPRPKLDRSFAGTVWLKKAITPEQMRNPLAEPHYKNFAIRYKNRVMEAQPGERDHNEITKRMLPRLANKTPAWGDKHATHDAVTHGYVTHKNEFHHTDRATNHLFNHGIRGEQAADALNNIHLKNWEKAKKSFGVWLSKGLKFRPAIKVGKDVYHGDYGQGHIHVYHQLPRHIKDAYDNFKKIKGYEEGFVDEKKKFYNRKQARQARPEIKKLHEPRMDLISEDTPEYKEAHKSLGVWLAKGKHKLDYRTTYMGLPISIETRRGAYRNWKDHDKKGKNKHTCPYGYIRRTRGMDDQHIDVFLGPLKHAPFVYIVTRMDRKEDFKMPKDQKVLLGFSSAEEAKRAFLYHFDDPKYYGGMKIVPFGEFYSRAMATKEGNVIL